MDCSRSQELLSDHLEETLHQILRADGRVGLPVPDAVLEPLVEDRLADPARTAGDAREAADCGERTGTEEVASSMESDDPQLPTLHGLMSLQRDEGRTIRKLLAGEGEA